MVRGMHEVLLRGEAVVSMLAIEVLVRSRGLTATLHALAAVARLGRRRRRSTAAHLTTIPQIVSGVAQTIPGQHVCLAQALTALVMCRRRRWPVTFHLGAALDEQASSPQAAFVAHAWIAYRGQDLTGGSQGFARFPALPYPRP